MEDLEYSSLCLQFQQSEKVIGAPEALLEEAKEPMDETIAKTTNTLIQAT